MTGSKGRLIATLLNACFYVSIYYFFSVGNKGSVYRNPYASERATKVSSLRAALDYASLLGDNRLRHRPSDLNDMNSS